MKFWVNRNCIVRILENTLGVRCESCFSIPQTLYCLEIKDNTRKTWKFIRFECYDCTKKIFKQPGYFNQFVDFLRDSAEKKFPQYVNTKNISFIADRFICSSDVVINEQQQRTELQTDIKT